MVCTVIPVLGRLENPKGLLANESCQLMRPTPASEKPCLKQIELSANTHKQEKRGRGLQEL